MFHWAAPASYAPGGLGEANSAVIDKTNPDIDGYRILRVIGHGGMSTVYLAEQASLERKVALKVMLADALADEISRARFENEARIIARLEHPNIVGIFEVGRTTDGLPFYSMPHLSHGHLAQRKLAGDQPKVAAILRSLLQALDYAHVRGVVHRDVKAENVLFDDSDRPMLADFGIALRRGSNPRLTNAGLAVGSTAYMPPEQARGQEVDRRADLYSIGVLTWEMLMGRLPYNAGDSLSMAVKHVQEPVPRLPAPLKHWQGFIDKAMAKQPEQRFSSAHEMLAALDALEQRAGKVFAVVEIPEGAPSSPAARHHLRLSRGAWLAVGITALAALALGLLQFMPGQETTAPAGTPIAAPDTADTASVAPADGAQPSMPPGTDAAHLTTGLSAYVANAEDQLRTGRLLTPPNANAWDSVEAARLADPTHADTLRLTALLFDALGDLADRSLRGGDTATSRLAFQRAQTLDQRRGGTGAAITLLRQRLDKALEDRLNLQLARPETRRTASILLGQMAWLGLSDDRQRALQARILAGGGPPPAATTARAAAAPVATAPTAIITVQRADYARFAAAVGRGAAECGKGFFGRTLKWNNTGGGRRPVVCVSTADALAYAAWLGAQDGHHYRIPSAGELRNQPESVASWVSLCADHACQQRMVSGKTQPLDASRGYDDVGIRLARVD